MIKILNYKNSLSLKKLSTFLERRRFAENKDIGIVQNILKDIKKNKVKALKKYELRFGNNTQINISKDQIKKSIKNLDPKVKKAIDFAYKRIFNFHLKQKKKLEIFFIGIVMEINYNIKMFQLAPLDFMFQVIYHQHS